MVELLLLSKSLQHWFELVVMLNDSLLHQHQLVLLGVPQDCTSIRKQLLTSLTLLDESLEVGFIHHFRMQLG